DYFRRAGYEVIAVANPGAELDSVGERDQIQVIGLHMEREISPLRDLLALWRMWRLLRRIRPDIVCAATSKASLLAMLAARAVGVPARVYMQWGLRLETTRGLKHRLLAFAERIAARCAHRVWCVSDSLRSAFLEAGFAPPSKTTVLLNGSSNGVDVKRFE